VQRSKDFFAGVYRLRPYENIEGCVKKCVEFIKRNLPLIMALMLAMFFALLWYSTYLENQQIKIQKDEMTDQII
jgi:ABC-type amino acid transport system permease subunit